LSQVLDLAAGSGEITLALRQATQGRAETATIQGCDPYTGEAYRTRTGSPCEPLSFEAIADGAIRGRRYSCVICSFAMHLVEGSRLPAVCWALSEVTDHL